MNRRIVLVDREESTDYFKYFGCGLGDEVYVLQELKTRPEEEIRKILTIGNTDAIMLVKGEPFKYLQQFYHFGIRNENFSDCAKLRRLSIEGGSFAKCVTDFPDKSVIADFMSPNFTIHKDFSWFVHKVIHTLPEAMAFLEYLESLPIETNFGFDYEASGMPLDRWFEISGASICTIKYGGFISFTDIRDSVREEDYLQLLSRLGKFLVDRMNRIWTYNMQYEFQVSHRMLGVDLYNLCDASVFNVLDGNHLKKFSLKWTGNMVLESTVWDTEFDRISELIDSMLFIEIGKLKREKRKVLKVTQDNFKDTPEWKKLCELYPNYVNEFERLILKYWGNPFMCIPSDILGHYCNLDAFYTLMIYETKKSEYSEEAIQVFLDNIRLGCRLHSSGLYIDEDYRLFYQKECHKLMAWGITYCATARCFIKMEKHKAKMANIKKYNPTCQKLLRENKFFNGNAIEIVKNLLLENIDTMDIYDTGLNEGSLMMSYGEDFAVKFSNALKESMNEVKMKTKIDDKVWRKKKLMGILVEKVKNILELDKLKFGDKHLELEKYLFYEKAYNELVNISKTQLGNINNIPEKIKAFGQEFTLLDYSTFISDTYFKCKSPIENDEIITEMFELYRTETSFLAALSESVQQLPGEKKEEFFKSLGLKNIEEAYNHFMKEWESYSKLDDLRLYNGVYPEKIFNIALESWRGGVKFESSKDVKPVKDVWADFTGFTIQSTFYEEYNDQFIEYGKPFVPEDFNDKFFFMRKFIINYLLYKKYSKVLSTYIDGMFYATGKWVIEGEDHIPLREAQEGEPGAVFKVFTKYEVNTKSSKRWSSGFHTIISHSDLKDCLVPPYHYDENGNKVRENFIETYFDISSAEVKAAGYASGDPDLIAKFDSGEDIYIYSAKLYLGDRFDSLSKADKKLWRKRFKTIFLGVLYGLGKKSLAERLNCSEAEAEDIIQGLYKSFPKLREYVSSQQQYPFEHNGLINSMLGDKLKIQEFEYYLKATSERERKGLVARIQRLGVNLPIQGGTSSIMASGFFNSIRISLKEGWRNPLQPIIVVHDSNTNYVPTSKIFDIRGFYDKNYTGYCKNIGPKISLLFDLLAGESYERALQLNTVDENTIEFTGTAYNILGLYDKIMSCPDMKVECSMGREEIVPNYITDPIDRFIREKGTSVVKDISKYTVQFKRVG